MAPRHVTRKTQRTAEETARLRSDRERYQRDKPSPEQLLAEGGHADFITLGQFLELRQLFVRLKQIREDQKMTLAELADATGIDQAALSRIENGRNSNPTVDTLFRIASALGKIIYCTCQEAPSQPKRRDTRVEVGVPGG